MLYQTEPMPSLCLECMQYQTEPVMLALAHSHVLNTSCNAVRLTHPTAAVSLYVRHHTLTRYITHND